MYLNNFFQPTVCLQQQNFENTLVEVDSLHLYASFGTFCIQIGHWLFSFEDNDLLMFKHYSKAECGSNDWKIWTQKLPKEA